MNDHRININIGADANVGDINVVITQLGALNAAVDKVDGKTAKVKADADTNAAEQKLEKLTDRFVAYRDEIYSAELGVDTAEALADLEFMERQAKNFANQLYKMRLETNNEEVSAELEEIRQDVLSLAKDARIKIEANTSDAEAGIAQVKKEMSNLDGLKAAMSADLEVGEFNREAKLINSQLDSIDRRVVKAIVQADTAEAVAKWTALRAMLRDQKVELRVDVDTGSALPSLGALTGAVQYLRSLWPGLVSAVSSARAGLMALAAGVVASLLPALGAAAGAVGILGGALASAAGGFGLLYAAFRPTITAFKEYEQGSEAAKAAMEGVETASEGVEDAQTSLADATRNGARAVRDAKEAYADSLEAVKDARRGVAQAEQDAAESIRDAQEAYKDSLDAVADARANLTKVERDGARAIADAQEAVGDARRQAAADTRAANAAVTDAEENLEQARDDLTTATEDLEAAQTDLNRAMRDEPLRMAEAELDLADARDRVGDATRDYNAAVREHGRNSEEATDAARDLERAELDLEQQTRDTNRMRKEGSSDLQSATRAYEDASDKQKDAAAGVGKAEKDLSGARKDAAQTAREGARSIADAQKDVAAAQKDAAAATKEAQRGVKSALEDSADAQKDVVRAQREGSRSIKEAQEGVQDALRDSKDAQKDVARAQTDAARDIAKAQKGVKEALEELADAERKAEQESVKLTRSQRTLWEALQRFKKDAGDAFKPANDQLNYFGRDVLHIAQKLLPGLGKEAEQSAEGLRSAFKGVVDNTTTREINSYKRVLDSFSPIVSSLTRSMGNLGGALINVWRQAIPFIQRFFDNVEDLTERFKDYTNTAKGQKEINTFLESAEKIGGALWKAIGRVADAFWDVARNKEAMQDIAEVIDGIARAVSGTIRFLGWFAEAWGDVRDILRNLDGLLGPIARFIGGALRNDTRAASNALGDLWKAIKGVGEAIWDLVKDLPGVGTVTKWASGALRYLRQDFLPDIRDWAGDLLKWITQPFQQAYDRIVGNSIVPDLRKDVVSVFRGMGGDLGGIMGDLKDNIGDRFNEIKENAGERMGELKDNAVNAAKNAKDGVGGWFMDMKDGVGKTMENFRDDHKEKAESTRKTGVDNSKWLSENVRENFWDMKNKAIDTAMEAFKDDGISKSKSTRDGMTPPMKDMAEKNRGYLSALLEGMQKVNENAKLGLPEIKGFSAAVAETGTSANTAAEHEAADQFGVRAAGGLIEPLRGPVKYLVGDQGQREWVINPSRDDNVPFLKNVAEEMGFEVKPKDYHQNRQSGLDYYLQNPPTWLPNLAPAGFNPGSGEGLGSTMHTYIPQMQDYKNRVMNQFPDIYTNTYSNHPMGFEQPYYRERSIDHWGGGGRGAPIGTDRGGQVASFAIDDLGSNLNWLIWNGRMLDAGGWGPDTSGFSHHDHVHVTAFADKHSNVSGNASMSGMGIDISDDIEKYMPKPWTGGDSGNVNLVDNEGIGGLLRTKMIGILEDKASTIAGGDWNGSGNVDEWIREGFKVGNAWPEPSADQLSAMKSRVMQESGGDPSAINDWDVNAQNGTPSKGLVQIIEPTWEAHRKMFGADVGSFDENWDNPIKSVATSTRYMKNEYGHVVGANGQGYTEGGLALKPHVASVAEHGPELFLPLHDRDSVRRFVDQLGQWHEIQRDRADSFQVRHQVRQQHDLDVVTQTARNRGSEERMVRELRGLGDKIEKSVRDKVNARIDNIEELTDAMIAGAFAAQDSPLGGKIHERHQARQYTKMLKKRGKR